LAATFAVVITVSAALTLVPAAFGLVGDNIDRWHLRHPVAESSEYRDGWKRYAEFTSRHPWQLLVLGVVFLGVCAIPLFSMRLGHVDDGADPAGSTTRNAYDWIAQGAGPGFGPGANGPFIAVIDVQHASASATQVSDGLSHALQGTAGIASFTPFGPSPDGRILVSTITPASGPQDAATGGLFDTLVDQTLPDALHGTGAQGYLTGNTAGQFDFRDTVTQRLPIIIAVVLVLAFLLLMTVFRSILIPIKAVLLNLLTTGASYGILVAAFQFGWGDGILGLDEPVPIESYVPMMMFAIVFGLSMDYEIFLLSRISESYHRTGDNRISVSAGLSTTARVISSAAFIMTAVFLSFVASTTVVVKMLALGLAISVVLDATVVRLILVPSTMFLLGKGNWWLPKWLDRALPHLRA
ncbi:MAG TPA: MMPL family transporter, partial [Actinospica sp.]|nr:MMPL family transporter [Actinospica sp.]